MFAEMMSAGARAARWVQLRMSAADREAFHDQFISFRTLGVIAPLGWGELQARLDADGIRPTGGSAKIYSSTDVAHLLP